jgi:hypothetical protein
VNHPGPDAIVKETVLRNAEGFAMSRLNMIDARCTALFASGLQRSDALTGDAVAEAVRLAVRQYGVRGCAARMAEEFGEHPEVAIDRMRWVRQLVGGMPTRTPRSAHTAVSCARRAA